MSLQLLGLGFSFGAKDAGLKSKQKQVAAGFSDIAGEVEKMGRKAEGGTKPVERMTQQLSGSSMDKLTESINMLSMSLGKDLPKSSHRGAESMHRAADNISEDEDKIGSGVNFIRDAFEKLEAILRINKLQAFIQSISLAKLGEIAHNVGGIAENGRNLTTTLEGTIVAANKTSRSMGANFGLAGKDLQRFTGQATSMGIALNIGTEKAAEAVYNVTLASKELSAVGLKSASDLAKFSEVTGVSAGEMTQIFKKAGALGIKSADQLRELAGAALASGTQIGDVAGQFKMLPHVLDLVQRRAQAVGKTFDPKKMAAFASQTLALSGAFYDMGESADSARELATGLADKMVESGEDFKDMFAGTKTDLSEFMMSVGVATGDINNSFATMNQGPVEFISGMAEMVKKAKKSGNFTAESMNLLRGQLGKTFGNASAAKMVQFFDTATDAQLASMKTASKATGDLGKFAKAGFTTGRTLSQEFDLMEESFVMSFRNIGRSAAVDFVDKTGKEFNRFNAQLQATVKKGGPLAMIITKFSEIHQIGALALIPQTLRPMAAVFGTLVKEAAPMIGILGSLGFRLEMLASPFTALITAAALLATWFVSLRLQGKTTGQALQIMSSKIQEGAKKLWATVKNWVGKLFDYLVSVDWGAVFTRVFDALVDVMQGAGDLLRRIPWEQIFKSVLSAVGKMFEYVASKEFLERLMNVAASIGDGIKFLINKLFDLFEYALDAIGKIDVGKAVKHVLTMALHMTEAVLTILVTAVTGFLKRLPAFANKLLNVIIQLLTEIPTALGEFFSSAGDEMQRFLPGLVSTLLDGIWDVLKAIPGLVMRALRAIPSIVASLGNMLKGAVDLVAKAILGILQGVEDWLVKKFPEDADTIHTVFADMKEAVLLTGRTLKKVIEGTVKAFQYLWDVAGEAIKVWWKIFDTMVVKPIKAIASWISDHWSTIWSGIATVAKPVWDLLKWIFSEIEDSITDIGNKASWIADKFSGAWDSITHFFGGADEGEKELGKDIAGVSGAFKKQADLIQGVGTTTVSTFDMISAAFKKNSELWHNVQVTQGLADRIEAAKTAADMVEGEDKKFKTIAVYQQAFVDDSTRLLSAIPDRMQDAASKAQQALSTAYFNQLKEIQTHEYASVEDRKKAMTELDTWRAAQLKTLSDTVTEQTKNMQAGGEAAADGMEKAYSAIVESVAKKSEEALTKTNAVVGSIQKETGLTAEEAASHMEALASIKPKEFAANLAAIKTSYIDFAKTAKEETQKMLDVTNKAFDEANKQAIEHWTKQKTNISLMEFNDSDIQQLSETIGATIDRTFATLTGMISDRVEDAVSKAFVNAFGKVIIDAKKFVKDSMSVFNDLARLMVKKFGETWAKILDFTAAAISAIEADTARAVANLSRIELAMKGSAAAKAQSAGAEVRQDVKADKTKSDFDNLFQATHHPEWYENDFKLKAMEIIAALNGLVAVLSQMPRAGASSSGGASTRTAAQLRSNNYGTGVGDTYGLRRANGRPSS